MILCPTEDLKPQVYLVLRAHALHERGRNVRSFIILVIPFLIIVPVTKWHPGFSCIVLGPLTSQFHELLNLLSNTSFLSISFRSRLRLPWHIVGPRAVGKLIGPWFWNMRFSSLETNFLAYIFSMSSLLPKNNNRISKPVPAMCLQTGMDRGKWRGGGWSKWGAINPKGKREGLKSHSLWPVCIWLQWGKRRDKLDVTGRSTVGKQAVSQPQDNLFSELEPGQSQWRIMLWEPWW